MENTRYQLHGKVRMVKESGTAIQDGFVHEQQRYTYT